MKIQFIILVITLLSFQQNSIASNSLINEYQYPFKGEVLIKMRLSDICDPQKKKNTLKSRGIPESSPQYTMTINMLGSQCDMSRKNHIKDSVALDVKRAAMLEVLDEDVVNDVTLFQVSLREYESNEYLNQAWLEINKLKYINTFNNNFMFIKGAYNSSVAYMKKNNVIIQIDMMQTKNHSVENLKKFSTLYSKWLVFKK